MVSLLVASLLAGTPQSCRAAYEAVRYRDAIAECSAALPAATREQLPELYRFLALALSSQGDHDQAQRAFVSLLALDPAARLAESYSPRLRADFEAARASGAGAPIRLGAQAAVPPQVGVPLEVTVTVDDGPAKPITDIGVTPDGATQRLHREGELKVTLETPTEAGQREVKLSGYDALGGLLVEQRTMLDIAAAPSRSAALSWKVWGIVALVSGVAGVALGAVAKAEQGQVASAHFGSDGQSLQSTGNALALSADVGFGLAAATALVALIMLIAVR
jgi:hypothetical protein